MKRILIVALLAALVAGCQTTAHTAGPVVPPDYRARVANYLLDRLKDPYSVREAEISAPTVSMFGVRNIVCVRYNAKNSFGAYIGRETQAFLFSAVDFALLDSPVFCANVPLRPFPELMSKSDNRRR